MHQKDTGTRVNNNTFISNDYVIDTVLGSIEIELKIILESNLSHIDS